MLITGSVDDLIGRLPISDRLLHPGKIVRNTLLKEPATQRSSLSSLSSDILVLAFIADSVDLAAAMTRRH